MGVPNSGHQVTQKHQQHHQQKTTTKPWDGPKSGESGWKKSGGDKKAQDHGPKKKSLAFGDDEEEEEQGIGYGGEIRINAKYAKEYDQRKKNQEMSHCKDCLPNQHPQTPAGGD